MRTIGWYLYFVMIFQFRRDITAEANITIKGPFDRLFAKLKARVVCHPGKGLPQKTQES